MSFLYIKKIYMISTQLRSMQLHQLHVTNKVYLNICGSSKKKIKSLIGSNQVTRTGGFGSVRKVLHLN